MNFIIAYDPNFSKIPARITEPGVGASTNELLVIIYAQVT
jgi:hypothetical protein